ncbi:PREDICTED: VQ motif-containing protein 31-like isoform X2 [Camelina sativa]|nr:PREDICTED: VQ motif-containing protein 31-like isoform X2 [Camelina sativa]
MVALSQVRGQNRWNSKPVLSEKNLHMNNKGSQNVATCKPVTTFVQTDTNTFREIVQRLTGPSENNSAVAPPEATVIKTVIQKKPTSKLHERRQCMRPKLEIVKPPLSFKPTEGEPDSCTTNIEEEGKAIKEEEEKAIKERRFYLHPSPRSKPGYTEPELLPLFPLTSPNSSGKP